MGVYGFDKGEFKLLLAFRVLLKVPVIHTLAILSVELNNLTRVAKT